MDEWTGEPDPRALQAMRAVNNPVARTAEELLS
jgi:hypothetical protein